MIRIDGSSGEGGGQILRSALSLSLVTGKPFRIENIRAKRERAGLLRQHLTAVLAAAEVGAGTVEGAELNSKTLTFTPGTIKPGSHRFVIGTAGSGTLVLQTVLPALITAPGPSLLKIEGGTHNLHAPPFDFLDRCFLPVINRLGPKVGVSLERYGFYPAGGGCFKVSVEPSARLSRIELIGRGEITACRVVAIVANLPRTIAQRELDTIARRLKSEPLELEIIETDNSVGPGNIVLIELVTSMGFKEVICGFGRLRTSAEAVATEASDRARAYLASEAVAGEHLADQLLLPFALAGGGTFTAQCVTRHARTNMEVISAFLPVEFVVREEPRRTRIEVHT